MPLPSTGAINLGQVNVELSKGATVPISLGDTAVRALAGKPSGPVSLGDLRGKAMNKWQFTVQSSNGLSGNDVYGYHDEALAVSIYGFSPYFGASSGTCTPSSIGGASVVSALVETFYGTVGGYNLRICIKGEGTEWQALRRLVIAGYNLPGLFVLCNDAKTGIPNTYYWTTGGPVTIEGYNISPAVGQAILAAIKSPQGATYTFDRAGPPQ